MLMSNKIKCALRVMMYLSTTPQTTITVQDIYEKEIVSKRYLEQVFADLKHHGFITSVKGKKGGYYLSKQPSDITLKDLVLAADSSLFSNESPSFYTKNDMEELLDAHIWEPLNEIILTHLSEITLAQLVNTYSDNYTQMFYI
jgi:Rrf2 family transcriptional regulator, cysteine metabolism repressor